MALPKIRWGSLFVGLLIGLVMAGGGSVMNSADQKADTLVLKQMLAIENIEKTQGREPSSKAEIDAEVARWEDFALRVRTLQKTGKPFDEAFVYAPWRSSK